MSYRKYVLNFWFPVIAFVLMFFLLVFGVYRSKFGGDLSSVSGDWSNFGGYMGGLLGPVVSFFTLLAVLRTVHLQKDLLQAQKAEFATLNKLQGDTFESQSEQLRLAKIDSDRSSLLAYQTTQLRLIEMYIEHQDSVADRCEQQIQQAIISNNLSFIMSGAIDGLNKKKAAALNAANSLRVLALEISINQYDRIDQIQMVMGPRLMKILGLEQAADS
ncbi:hypothetical protein [Pseudomonas entomophila]|uniref:hypothetical protein n=1 Tax=Pseudomonas entomophila TaxID=312306 RepID=UPI003EBA5A5C